MHRIINFRAFLYIFISIVISTLFCNIFISNKILAIVLFFIQFFAILILTIILLYKRKLKYGYTALIALFCSVLAFVISISMVMKFTNLPEYKDDVGIYGRVKSCVYKDDNLIINLHNVKVNNKDIKANIKINAYVGEQTNFNQIQTGDIIELQTKLHKNNLTSNGIINGNIFDSRLCYNAVINIHNINITKGSMNFYEKLNHKIYNLCTFNMRKWGDIAFSMLTGNKDGLESNIRNYYNATGIGHILAVSGLHIGFLALMVSFILRFFPFKIRTNIIIESVILIFYACLVGLSSSVVRAVIMCIIGLCTYVNGKRKDSLSSLCFAGMVILTFSPMSLYTVGFLMGFSAVFGIVLFSKEFTNLLTFIKLPSKLASAISVSLSAQVGITPIMIFYFNNISIYSIIANIVFIPFIMIIFNCLFISLLIALIIPPARVLLKVIAGGIAVLDISAEYIAGLPYSTIIIYSSAIIFSFYILYFLISRYVMLHKKWIYNFVIIISCIILLMVQNIPYKEDNSILFVGTDREVTSIIEDNNKTIIVGDLYNGYLMEDILIKSKIRKIDEIYIHYLGVSSAKAIIRLDYLYDLPTINYIDGNIDGIKLLIDKEIKVNNIMSNLEKGYSLSINYGEKYECFSYKHNKINIGFYSIKHKVFDDNILNNLHIIRCFTNFNKNKIFLVNQQDIELPNKNVYISCGGEGKIFNFDSGKGFLFDKFEIY